MNPLFCTTFIVISKFVDNDESLSYITLIYNIYSFCDASLASQVKVSTVVDKALPEIENLSLLLFNVKVKL